MKNNKWLPHIKFLPFALCIILMICFLTFNTDISAQTIVAYSPENPIYAALILISIYAVKSISVVFPILILEIAGGHLFSPIRAIIINITGILIGYILSYWIGHFSGVSTINKLTQNFAGGSLLFYFVYKQKTQLRNN